MSNLLTPSGKHRIIDITAFLPGRPIPNDYLTEAGANKLYFFIPSDWNEANDWGCRIGRWRKFPMLYSIGFNTPEEAMAEAIDWEVGANEREVQSLKFQEFCLA